MGRCANCDAPKNKPCARWRDTWTDCDGNIMMERNEITKNFRVMSGCFYDVMMRTLVELCRSTNSAASAVENSRNIIVSGFTELMPQIFTAIVHNGPERLTFERSENGGETERQ